MINSAYAIVYRLGVINNTDESEQIASKFQGIMGLVIAKVCMLAAHITAI